MRLRVRNRNSDKRLWGQIGNISRNSAEVREERDAIEFADLYRLLNHLERFSSLRLTLHHLNLPQLRRVVADNAPQGIIVDAEVTVNEAIAGGNNHPLGDFGMDARYRIQDIETAVPTDAKLLDAAS